MPRSHSRLSSKQKANRYSKRATVNGAQVRTETRSDGRTRTRKRHR